MTLNSRNIKVTSTPSREDKGNPKGMKASVRKVTLILVVLIIVYVFYWFVNEVKIMSTIKNSVKERLDSTWLFISTKVNRKSVQKPHIIFILADDLGFNDVGYHNPVMKTPVIDKLANEGVRLENYYVQPICSPTRTQLMSGRYQIHFGMQHGIIWPAQPYCLPLNEVTIAQKLKEAGYSTHIVGKWHLGFYRKECTPLYRGFDSFYGFLSGGETYYHHNFSSGFPFGKKFQNMSGYDFRRNEQVDYDADGQYSTLVFGKEAQKIVEQHDADTPLFLYLPFQAVHAPLTVPESYVKPYEETINNTYRRTFAGMTSCMDEAIGNLTDTLKQKGMWENTVLVFSTDNGGTVWSAGNNWPLRGWKWSFWEGGIRGIGFVSGPLISNPGRQSWDLMHVTDWFPTLVKLAGGNLNGTLPLDGFDQWETISTGKPTKRYEILHGIDPTEDWKYPPFDYKYCHQGVIRVGDWKLLVGCPGNGSWIAPPSEFDDEVPSEEQTKKLFLFNIKLDPEERNDMSDRYPEKVAELMSRLEMYNQTSVPVVYPDPDPEAAPDLHNGVWGPWV